MKYLVKIDTYFFIDIQHFLSLVSVVLLESGEGEARFGKIRG